jgi:hypothetical protein
MTEPVQAALARLAPLLRRQRSSADATTFYDVLSDALIWSDESPEPRVLRTINGWQVLRFVFHFRTQLILGRPEERDPDPEGYASQVFVESRDAWSEARRLFPKWPGFHAQRCSPDLRGVMSPSAPRAGGNWRRSSESLMRAGPGRKHSSIVGTDGSGLNVHGCGTGEFALRTSSLMTLAIGL